MSKRSSSWSDEEILKLEELYKTGMKSKDISKYLCNRTIKAIENRIAVLKLYDKYKNDIFEKQLNRMNYDVSMEYGVGYTINTNLKFYFDLEDYEKIKQSLSWSENKKGYISGSISGKSIRMHRLVMNCTDENIQIDHINGNKYDNRKVNLRTVTNQQNHMNKGISKNNLSGKVGVSFCNTKKKWRAYITMNDKQISLGYHYNKEDAIKARKDAEEKYFGEYRRSEENLYNGHSEQKAIGKNYS